MKLKNVLFLFVIIIIGNSLYGQEKNTQAENKNWIITSLGHISFQLTNTVKFPHNREEIFRKVPFEVALIEAGVSFYNGRVGIGTCVFKRETPNHFMVNDPNPFFNGLGKTSWFPIIIRTPLLIKMKYNWFTGMSLKYELSTYESFKSDDFYKAYLFNTHTLCCELNTQGTIIELGYSYHNKYNPTTYYLPGKDFFYLKIGIGFLGNYFWNWKLRNKLIRERS